MQFKYSAPIILVWLVVLGLGGCGTVVPLQIPESAEKSPEKLLVRAQLRWDALLKRDMDKAYQFISPGGRSLMALDDYRQRANAGFWRGAKVVKEPVCAVETCEVTVMVDMVVEGVKFSNPVKETWILDAGKWWFVYQG